MQLSNKKGYKVRDFRLSYLGKNNKKYILFEFLISLIYNSFTFKFSIFPLIFINFTYNKLSMSLYVKFFDMFGFH